MSFLAKIVNMILNVVMLPFVVVISLHAAGRAFIEKSVYLYTGERKAKWFP